jgi:hypothetical protein
MISTSTKKFAIARHPIMDLDDEKSYGIRVRALYNRIDPANSPLFRVRRFMRHRMTKSVSASLVYDMAMHPRHTFSLHTTPIGRLL